MNRAEILIVDDEPINLTVLRNLLTQHYVVRACKSGADALSLLDSGRKPDLILLDIVMPDLSGYDTLLRLKETKENRDIPVIFISALDSVDDEEKGFHLGAVDYISKPFRPVIVLERIRVHLELKKIRDQLKVRNEKLEIEVSRRVRENTLIHEATLNMLTQLVETRDGETKNHIIRTKSYVEILARRLKLDPKYELYLTEECIMNISNASSLHDIGKIGIPDSILLKPGSLSSEEYSIMKNHCRIGARAIHSVLEKTHLSGTLDDEEELHAIPQDFFEKAENIALYHHEHWDGSGYPVGLSGEQIPLSARIMALVDVFDALTNRRVYKEAWPIAGAVDYILSQRGKYFCPDIVDAFISELPVFQYTHRKLNDTKGDDLDGKA